VAQRLAALLERRRSAPRVLYLESDDEAAGGLRALLNGSGYRVRSCRDIRRLAREVLRCEPDLVLIDLPRREAPAGDVVRWLRGERRSAGVPVILLTPQNGESGEGGEEESVLESGLGPGGGERVAKPVAAPAFLAMVAARIEHHRALARLFTECASGSAAASSGVAAGR
jgi:DNA-binding response OmpR family regulator